MTLARGARAVPLNIFEARYRVLFNTLLAGADGCALALDVAAYCLVCRWRYAFVLQQCSVPRSSEACGSCVLTPRAGAQAGG
jgi:hypothetical protein